jgi:cell division protein FtsI/penicillin-binding protein 2
MTRRHAILLFLASSKLDRLVHPERGCALLLDVRSKHVIAANSVDKMSNILALPGSTLKPFVLAALLRTGRLSGKESYRCPGDLRILGREMNCSHPRLEQPVQPDTALAYSCNCFVARVAERFRPGELAIELQRSGFGVAGSVRRARSQDAQRLQALGEDGILITVVELASAYRLLSENVQEARYSPVLAGLEEAVQFGTARRAQIAGEAVAGKTGSSYLASGEPVAWFAGFMPSRRPEVVVVIMLKGRSGGADAAPVAGEILQAYRAGYF